MTQAEMGELLSMSQTGYSKYETGENDIPTMILIELADYHNTSVDYLLNITDVKTPYPKTKKARHKSEKKEKTATATASSGGNDQKNK